MRTMALLGILALSSSVQAQGYPVEMAISVSEVEVRSGPTAAYSATSKLKYGDHVLVKGESKQEKGWLAIYPPLGSFSLVNAKFVDLQSDSCTGIVNKDDVGIRPGSLISNRADMEAVYIKKGSQVIILDKGKTGADGDTWLKIQPVPTEVRFIPGEAVQNRTNNNYAGINGQLTNMAQNPWQAAQTASLSRTNLAGQNVTYQPTWSSVGTLRRAAFDKDGQPAYVLEDSKGKMLLYVSCQSGLTLREYVGRRVALYGPVVYRSDDYLRTYFMTASHVALY